MRAGWRFDFRPALLYAECMEEKQHPWIGKSVYMDFGDGFSGGETAGTITKVSANGLEVTVDIGIGEPVIEDLREAIYVEVDRQLVKG